MKRTLHVIAAAMTGLILGCQADDRIAGLSPTREPGALELRLTTPNPDDGALLVSIRGGPIDSAMSRAYEVAAIESAPGEYVLLVRGTIRSGPLVRILVPDVAIRDTYTAVVTQAVSRTYVRRDAEHYLVTP